MIMTKIVLPYPTGDDADAAIQDYKRSFESRAGLPTWAAHRALLKYREKLQAFLDEQQTDKQQAKTAQEIGPFTADNLPEEAKWNARFDVGPADLLNDYVILVLNRLDAAHNGRLSALLSGATPSVSVAGPFTAYNLPEAARATDADMAQWFAVAPVRAAANQHAALVLDRLYAAHPGLREWLLNGTAPAFTDEPPEVTDQEAAEACNFFWKDEATELPSMRKILSTDRARVWQTRRPAPADPVRFALEKVDPVQWGHFLDYIVQAVETPEASLDYVVRFQLAEILPVAETKQWAELTGDEAYRMACEALTAHVRKGDTAAAAASLRASLSAYAPPPRKVEVTPEVMKAFLKSYYLHTAVRSSEHGFENIQTDHLAGVRAALAVANEQAEARESEAVAEVAPGAEKRNWLVRIPAAGPTPETAWRNIITDLMTRAEAEKQGKVVGWLK